MTLWVCLHCTTAYSVGAPRCPHCSGTDHVEEGTMPKITVHGGPTDKNSTPHRPPRERSAERGNGEVVEARILREALISDISDALAAEPVEIVDLPAESESPADDEPVTVPDSVRGGSVAYIQTWVGDDPDRARAVLDLENARFAPRVTLVAALERLLDGDAGA